MKIREVDRNCCHELKQVFERLDEDEVEKINSSD
jgi:hypothetical protein